MKDRQFQHLKEITSNDYQQITLIKDNDGERRILKKFLQHNNQLVYEKLKEISHPNVCKIVDVFEIDNGFGVIEEYLGSRTLMDGFPSANIDRFFDILFQICDGLSCLHQLNIVHRDIKPENIYLVGDLVVINDFDISKPIQIEANIQRDTEILGTVGYASPEQYGFSRSDQRTDIYSLGILIKMLLVSEIHVNHRITNRIETVIKKCTQISPNDRYQKVSDVKFELQRIYQGHSKYTLPGFRSNQRRNKILGSLGYVFMIGSIISLFNDAETPIYEGIKLSIVFLIFILPILVVFTNYLDIHDLIPQPLRKVKWLGIILLTSSIFVVCFFGFWIVFSILDSLLAA